MVQNDYMANAQKMFAYIFLDITASDNNNFH